MKPSKLVIASVLMSQAFFTPAFGQGVKNQDALANALKWMAEQNKQANTGPVIEDSVPAAQPPVQGSVVGGTVLEGEPQLTPPVSVPVTAPVSVPEPEASQGSDQDSFMGPSGIKFGFMHTKQTCSMVTGNVHHKPTYCSPDDKDAMTELSGMVANINAQLETAVPYAKTAKVSIAYFSFSNSGVQKKVCEISSKGVQVRVFLDGGSAGTIDKGIMLNPDCLDKNGKLNVKLSYLGGQTDGNMGGIWRLHHNKFLMIDLGDGSPVKVNFSSGNLSSYGTSLHLDHWVTMVAPANSNVVKAQKCVMEGLEAADKVASGNNSGMTLQQEDAAIVQSYITTREQCFDKNNVMPRQSGGNVSAQINAMLEQEEIAPLFSPNDNNYVATSFMQRINRIPSGGYLYIAIQHFLHGGVARALVDASQRGVDVRIIMEDGALKGESEVSGVDGMIANLQSQAPNMQIRFAETNHNPGGAPAMMHNKLAILNGDMTFSGAGHYTKAALVDNWENFYFVTNKGVINSYAKYFKHLWEQSVDEDYTRSFGKIPTSKPAALHPKLLKAAQQN